VVKKLTYQYFTEVVSSLKMSTLYTSGYKCKN